MRGVGENEIRLRVEGPKTPETPHSIVWSSRKAKRILEAEEEVWSYPIEKDGHLNHDALDRIMRHSNLEAEEMRSRYVALILDWWHVAAYFCAGLIMYPEEPSEMFGAGSVDAPFAGGRGVPSRWETLVTMVALFQIVWSFRDTVIAIDGRAHGGDFAINLAEEDPLFWPLMAFFLLDFAIKIIAFKRPWAFFRNRLNIVDLFANFSILLAAHTWMEPDMIALRFLRIITVVLRVEYLVHVHKVLKRAFGSVANWVQSMVLTGFFVILLALIGQQLFAGAILAGHDRLYFGSFWMSCISTVNLSTYDGLSNMIEQGLTAGIQTAFFLILCVFILKTIISKIQIPMIIWHFEEAEVIKIQYQIYFGKAIGDGALVNALAWSACQLAQTSSVRLLGPDSGLGESRGT